jgi:hypothetical protein
MKLLYKQNLLRLATVCWLLVTFAALAAMYQLWWQRERALYLGKSVAEQRKIVFQRAGFPPVLAEKTAKLERLWPTDLHYKARGDANSLSYIQYLLIPRIPVNDAQHVIDVKGENLMASGGPLQPLADAPPAASGPKGLILSFAVLLGWAALLRKMWRGRATWPESLALACLFFTLLVLPTRLFFLSAQPAFGGSIILALVGWAMLTANVLVSKFFTPLPRPVPAAAMSRSEWIFIGLLGSIIALAVAWSFLMAVAVVPDDWDAWAIWGSKAKVLALGSGPLDDVTRFGHPDYPLLWPTIWAFSGWMAGGWEECWGKGWGAIFLFLCAWEMISAVTQQSGNRTAGLLAAGLFVSIPIVPLIASWSLAEAPLWLMMTCGLASFLRWRREGRQADAVLASLFAAAAAHTKNEGLLFALLLGLLFLFNGRRAAKASVSYLLIFSACYFLWFWWLRLHLHIDSSAAASLHHFDAFTSVRHAAGRVVPAGKAIFAMWKDVRQWNIVGFGVGIALISMLFQRTTWRDTLPFFLPTGLLAGYFVIILLNHEEIFWQIGTAWNRLTAQSLPLLLVPFFWRRKENS